EISEASNMQQRGITSCRILQQTILQVCNIHAYAWNIHQPATFMNSTPRRETPRLGVAQQPSPTCDLYELHAQAPNSTPRRAPLQLPSLPFSSSCLGTRNI
ncbi:hypothetical protein PIB30_111814, partial [Stylosanthes scabra]|nr:hypothetical protein [Stylosanthes scabra]